MRFVSMALSFHFMFWWHSFSRKNKKTFKQYTYMHIYMHIYMALSSRKWFLKHFLSYQIHIMEISWKVGRVVMEGPSRVCILLVAENEGKTRETVKSARVLLWKYLGTSKWHFKKPPPSCQWGDWLLGGQAQHKLYSSVSQVWCSFTHDVVPPVDLVLWYHRLAEGPMSYPQGAKSSPYQI